MASNQEKLNTVHHTLTPGAAGIKDAGDLWLKIDGARTDAEWLRSALTPGAAGVRNAGFVIALLAKIDGQTTATNAVIQNLVSAIQAVAGGAPFDQSKLLAGIDKTVREAIAEAVVQVDVNIAGGDK